MRSLSIMAFASFLVLWGVYSYLRSDRLETNKTSAQDMTTKLIVSNAPDSPRNQIKRRELDKIGIVINEKNVDIDSETKNQIRVAKKVFDIAQNLKEKQNFLEQSYMDHASSINDIKRLQNTIVEIKNKAKTDPTNTEKWDPRFVYYLMLQENYTYEEINGIKSLGENGLNPEEINYINELIKEPSFMNRISSFKGQSDNARSISSKRNEKDDFIETPEANASLESKIIEMDYNKEEKEVYGNN